MDGRDNVGRTADERVSLSAGVERGGSGSGSGNLQYQREPRARSKVKINWSGEALRRQGTHRQ